MAWLQSHQTLARHPKTFRAAKLLGISIPTLIGHLHLLWWWCLDYAEDGDLAALESEEIARTAMWDGDPQTFVDALLNAGGLKKPGFLEHSANGHLVVHDWDEYAGLLIDRRKRNTQHKRDVRMMSAGHPVDIPDLSGARVEKSRVEKSRVEKRDQPAFEVPEDFLPLTLLPGYKNRNHDKAFANIRAACADANVDVAEVIKGFAAEYNVLRHTYAWADPVAALKGRPLAIAISHVLEGQNAKSNSVRTDGSPGSRPEKRWPSAAHIPASEHSVAAARAAGAPLGPAYDDMP